MKNRSYRVIILEEGAAKEKSFIIRLKTVRNIAVALGFLILLLIVSLTLDVFFVSTFMENKNLRLENQQYKKQAVLIEQLKIRLTEMTEFKNKIYGLIGIEQSKDLFENADLPTDTLFYHYSKNGESSILLIDEEDQDTLRLLWPAQGVVSQEYNKEKKHLGIDIALKKLSPIRSAEEGVVVFNGIDSVFGKTVIIAHTNNIKTMYGHNDSVFVHYGEQIKKGQLICLSGNSGRSSAPHLHFGLMVKEEYIDPKQYLD